ncbi:MAG TPA: choice-of-anchor Q domain-containing protein [Pyrinomonadaceae bacterium]|jgi:CSLREA domain-containing protein
MKLSILKLFILTFFLFFPTLVHAQNGKLHTVNDINDTNDASIGDGICADAGGKCTLRAAIQEANTDNFQDAVIFALPLPATINLTLGELNIASNIYIAGPGARSLTVQRSSTAGTADFRIFHVNPNVGSLIVIRALKISNGKIPGGDGGGIYIEESNAVQLSDLTVSGNSANRGGGIANAGLLTLSRSLVNSNEALTNLNINGSGGGLFNQSSFGSADIVNSTVTENSAVAGGAIYNASDIFLINSTLSRNNAVNFGCSIVNSAKATTDVFNTIIGMDNSSAVSSLWGAFNSLGNNLITDARNSTGFTNGANNDQVSDNNTINPLLGNLADNGGQTDTLALLDGSPAINQGNSCIYNGNCPQPFPTGYHLSTDQRLRYLRLGGSAVDVGAFEAQSIVFNTNIGLGGVGNRTRAGGTLLVLTKAAGNEKQSRITNPFGNFRFANLTFGDVYILERKPKRLGEPRGLAIFAFDNLPLLPSPVTVFPIEDIKITWK